MKLVVVLVALSSIARADTVSEKIEYVDPDPTALVDGGDLYERVAAPTITGGVGLMRTQTGDIGSAGTFRIGLHVGVFQASSFLIGSSSTVAGDTNTHATGDLTISYTPWRFIELSLGVYNSSNKNDRVDANRTDPTVILALGDLALGIKGRYPVARFADVALRADVKFLNSVSGVAFNAASTNFAIDGIASFDLRHAEATRRVPLRLHVNVGYLLDNSHALLPSGQCATSTTDDSCIRSRVVETYAYGIGTSRVRLALAADAPLVTHGVGLQPMVEYHLDAAVASGDATVYDALVNDPAISSSHLTSRVAQYMTFGFRVRPVAGLVLDAAVDVALTSQGFEYGGPTAPWNVVLGAAYAYAPTIHPKSKVVTRTVTHDVVTTTPEGRVRGIVRDATTKRPLGNVTLRYVGHTSQLSGDDGTFVSYGFAPGSIAIEAVRDDYEPGKADVQIAANAETPIEIVLREKPPAAGQLVVKVADANGVAIPGAIVRASNAGAVVDADRDERGLVLRLPAGEYALEATADGYLGRRRRATIAAGSLETIDVALTKQPTTSHVAVTASEITLKGTIHFATSTAEILPDGAQLLDEVVDILVRTPQLARVRVEGHTDNRGVPAKNLALSQARAAAVVAYLVKQGIDATRLESEGYGSEKPLVPNLTPANRARNRRVTFHIVERAGGDAR